MADIKSAILSIIRGGYEQLADDGVCAAVTLPLTRQAQLIVPVDVFSIGDNTIEPPLKAVPAAVEKVNVIKPSDTTFDPYAPDWLAGIPLLPAVQPATVPRFCAHSAIPVCAGPAIWKASETLARFK